jgi:hypothetical protein
VLGNELLIEVDPEYSPGMSKFRVSAHTVHRVLQTLHDKRPRQPLNWTPPAHITGSGELFVGYLLLDALVGNTDRHHENWGVIRTVAGDLHLAPTFDHASSLGCHEVDNKRSLRLETRDASFTVAAFAAKARSALYLTESDTHPLLTREAFLVSARSFPNAGQHWIAVLKRITDEELGIFVDNVPASRITVSLRSLQSA